MPDRPWTRYYPPETPRDMPPLAWADLATFVDDTVERWRDQVAFTLFLPTGTRGNLTYGEVGRLSDELAVYLRDVAGLEAGDRVALQMPNCLAYPVAVFACLKAGLVMVNTNPLYTPAEMAYQFADSEAAALIAIDLFAPAVAAVLPGSTIRTVVLVGIADLLPIPARWLVRGVQKYVKRMIPAVTFAHVTLARALGEGRRRIAAGADVRAYRATIGPETIAAIQYTGGTTGRAKGAVLTHGNLLANVVQSLAMWEPFMTRGREVILTALPLYHVFAFTANLMIFFATGGRNVLVPSPRPLGNLRKVLSAEPITWFTGVNTLFAGLLGEPWFGACRLQLKGTVAGGMALTPEVGDRWEQVTGTPMYQGYGLTEASPVVALNPFHRAKRDAIGVPLPGTDIRLVDPKGADAGPAGPGELLVRGPQVMREYWRRPGETAEVLRDGWLSTGDVATIDDEGYLRIVDRRKELIVVSGFNVYPSEVEAALTSHPEVFEAAVVGVRDEHGAEVVCAHIVSRSPSLTADVLRAHCRQTLTNYKVPRRIVLHHDPLPKSPVGKILKRVLVDDAGTTAGSGAAAGADRPGR